MVGELELGRSLLEMADGLAAQGDHEPADFALLLGGRASEALHLGDPSRYLRYADEAAASFEQAGDERSACNHKVHVGFGLLEVGGFAEAEKALEGAAVTADRLGLPMVAAMARHNLGWALARSGRVAEASRVEREAAVAANRQANRRLEGGARNYLAAILAEAGDLTAAEREARDALVLLDGAPTLLPHALATLARIQNAAGRPIEALAAAREAMTKLEELGSLEEGDAAVRLALAEALEATGDGAAARTVIASARDRLLARAAAIADPHWRRSFLEAVPEHRRTLVLAAGWLPPPATKR
jgi:tetratricopeptide (TPR) repeat protein